MNLVELLQPFCSNDSVPVVEVSGVCLDSRLATSGDLYLAVGGAVTHGLQFVTQALAGNVAAVAAPPGDIQAFADARAAMEAVGIPLVEVCDLKQYAGRIAARFYGDPGEQLDLIAVTGTDGKTSVCQFIASALDSLGQRCGYIGTLGWGFTDKLMTTQLTTPDVVSLQRMLASLHAQGASAVALEASSHGLAEGRLDGLQIDIAVLTNFGRDHLDYHQTLDAYRAAKARLFEWPSLRAIVVNGEDDLGCELLGRFATGFATGMGGEQTPGCVAFYGSAAGATDSAAGSSSGAESPARCLIIRAENALPTATGLQFDLVDCGLPNKVPADFAQRFAQSSRLMGVFNIDNLLACYGVLRILGHAANDARTAIGQVAPVAGRMEQFSASASASVIIDFAHTPQALAAALAAARQHCEGELWVVFGCGGDRDPGKRAPMGHAAEAANNIVVTDDNPRTESSAAILQQIVAGMQAPERAKVIGDRRQAIQYALQHAASEDLVLIAGKGHESYQIIGTERLDYSDRETVGRLLREAS
jgi:UDP-N-acetylmuramoyl-L-alanyl-D-glutamate--2,6-diaminopimelate ligase